MNDSMTDQLRVGEVRSVQFNPSIVTFRNARSATTDESQRLAARLGWMGEAR